MGGIYSGVLYRGIAGRNMYRSRSVAEREDHGGSGGSGGSGEISRIIYWILQWYYNGTI